MNKIHVVFENIVHFDWEKTNALVASFDEELCEKMAERFRQEFKPFDDERATYWVAAIPVFEDIDAFNKFAD